MSNKFKPRLLKKFAEAPDAYHKFDSLNGIHPWMEQMPDGFVAYRVRELNRGEVAYFNFTLAKEMGLVPGSDIPVLTSDLKARILKTFSIQIINEYDAANGKKIDPKTIKPNPYMASRYLQLQHINKTGKTSGDGRGIWNGIVENHGQIWDVSSRGTGVTILAPGSVEAQKPLKTGTTSFGYGCGLAEIDELYGAAIFAELMHLQGLSTERVLCIIDLGNGHGIGVRAAPNLLRPAHLFRYLKQNRLTELKRGTDYFIERQKLNGKWPKHLGRINKYDYLLKYMAQSFGEFAAQLDIDYVFAWLDWDGDNVLMEAGIIDYGSVRQFGIRHDHYRYDDVERFSTNLNEQRSKARLIVQVFAQMVGFLKTGQREPLKKFAADPALKIFDQKFREARCHRLLYRVGFNQKQRSRILAETSIFQAFDKEFSYFERAKSSGSQRRVADGINHPALFNMRSILKYLPEHLIKAGYNSSPIKEEVFFSLILSQFAKKADTRIRAKHRKHIQNFQRLYRKLVGIAAGNQKATMILPGLLERAQDLNRRQRITGNALIQIVGEIINHSRKGMPLSDVQKILDQLIATYIGLPEVRLSPYQKMRPRLVSKPELYAELLEIVDQHAEDI